MRNEEPSKMDQLLDLLLDALQERQAARGAAEEPAKAVPDPEPVLPEMSPPAAWPVEAGVDAAPTPALAGEPAPPLPEKLTSIHLNRLLVRLSVALLGMVVLINIPFNQYGTNLARAMPDAQSLVIRDGLVLKGDGDEIYVLQANRKRWISSLDAFDHYGYSWEQVNVVDDAFLAQFPDGPPLSILSKCPGSPHVFAIENGVRRWIRDIPTFEAQGYVWEDVQEVPCARLRAVPVGPSIPPDAGDPPQP